ncbi:hypothetical protein [Streptomyces sp. NPDC052811]|uniref:hypothetical protein n=1 Tax=Streptomyces sp. NPDC052811 TaxID=3155731 RepID=UPI00341277DF
MRRDGHHHPRVRPDRFTELLDLGVLGCQPGDRQSLELCCLHQFLVSGGDAFPELGGLSLETLDLGIPQADDLPGLPECLDPLLELFGKVLVGAGTRGAVAVLSLQSAQIPLSRPGQDEPQHQLTGAAVNLIRINAWFTDAPHARTRTSHLAALRPAA